MEKGSKFLKIAEKIEFDVHTANLQDQLAAVKQFPGLVHTTHCHLTCAVPCRCRQKIWNIFDPCLTPNCFPLGFKIRFKIYIRRKIFFCYFPSFIRCSAKTT
ncbi:unnamed protein product [Oikopleura dioica]|uniref:Uncharacterized protein n=1 Tax=Oikopleura dioica TaxID=34765 RepID=E4X1I1_OIKDI|nr:unnamed protein product [Oikopleura dioica]